MNIINPLYQIVNGVISSFRTVFDNMGYLAGGIPVTFLFSTVGMLGGLFLGLIGASLRRSNFIMFRAIASSYVGLFRNTPLLIQLYLAYFGVPALGIPLNSWTAGMITIVVNNGAYLTEIIRGGWEGVNKTEIEAGYGLGMGHLQVMYNVIIPRLIRIVYPALVNQFILLIISSSLLGMIGVSELFQRALALEQRTFMSFSIYTVTMFMYVGITLILTFIMDMLAKNVLKIDVNIF